MSYSDERLDSQQLFDYCLLGQQLATNIATSCADTQHNHFFDSGGQQSDNWQTMSDVLTQQMKQLIGFEGKLNDGIQASIQCDQYIQQLMAQSDNQSLIDTNIDEIFDEKLTQIGARSEANVEEKEQYVKLMDVLSEFSVNTGNNGTDNGSDLLNV
ncbi:unnamed protein product [Medioppia subpectinata]|uniref:Uncharacterized protein n=1 Tax=Medioppia subpectinata TaxID=1979941 RepID=A0A7R9L185_9ACAR|nr:unnamed protein product [Medioppia subpectinata]CAG2112428.1 unnamed protein product [Medioppia subpectinata]